MHDVARRAGVSIATVSRVLSKSGLVAEPTRRRVMKAVDRLGYAPNSIAKTLRTARTRKLIITVPNIANPFFSQVLQGAEDAAQREGYAVLVGDTQYDRSREERYALLLKSKEADGLIFLGYRLPQEAAAMVRSMAPRCAPVVNGSEYDARLGIPSVHIDNEGAAAEAMDHLYALGHRRIGVVTGPLVSPLSRDRLRGAKKRARRHHAAADLIVVPGDFSIESGVAAVEQLLTRSDPPTAVFCFSDRSAFGVIEGARRHRISVPHQLSVVGFDDIQFARYMDPPLTTIAQPMRAMGETTVHLLLRILADNSTAPASITLPHTLTVRASTAPRV